MAQPPEGGRSPLDEQIAQVREAVDVLYHYTSDLANPPGQGRSQSRAEALTALSVIERHLHDMETALEAARAVLDYEHTPSRRSLRELRAALAALSAAPTATHQETK